MDLARGFDKASCPWADSRKFSGLIEPAKTPQLFSVAEPDIENLTVLWLSSSRRRFGFARSDFSFSTDLLDLGDLRSLPPTAVPLSFVNPETFYALVDGQMVNLQQQREVPQDVLRALGHQLNVFDQPTLTIGGWDDAKDGPLLLALSRTGQLVSLIAVNPAQQASLVKTITSIDQWLAELDLRTLSELSGNSVVFYEGLIELSPESSIVLSPRRHYVLVTALEHIDTDALAEVLPRADIDVRYLDVLQAPGSPEIIRLRTSSTHTSYDHLPPPPVAKVTNFAPVDLPRMSVSPSPEIPNEIEPLEGVAPPAPREAPTSDELEDSTLNGVAEVSSTEATPEPEQRAQQIEETTDRVDSFSVAPTPLPTLSESNETIDLTEPAPIDEIDLNASETTSFAPVEIDGDIEPGKTYDLAVLPLLFDPTGESLESISNEMFAVRDAIVVVVALPERRRDTPFEERRRFRWDTSLDRIQLLNDNGRAADGHRREVHLFVESARQPNYAVYVGQLNRTAFQTQTDIKAETAWFSITPTLSHDLFRLLRRGRLPQHIPADLETQT